MDKPAKRPNPDEAVLRMRNELKELLSRSPGAREVLPHLAGLDHALKAQGLAAFDALPPRVLKRALTQLQCVLPPSPGKGIAELRSRLAASLAKQEPVNVAHRQPAQPSFLTDDALQVSETSESDFMRVVEAAKRKD
jgi:hypothetical protein